MARKRKHTSHPAHEGMRKAQEQLRKLSNSPLMAELRRNPPKAMPELQEKMRKASESGSVKDTAERVRKIRETLEEAPPPKLRQRARGGGRPRLLTEKDVERGIQVVSNLKSLHGQRAFDELRKAGIGNDISDDVLRKWIVNVVRDQRRTKPTS